MTFSGPESRQFRALARLFVTRLFDTDVVQVRGDIFSIMSHAAALGAAMSFVVCLMVIHVYVTGNPPPTARWTHEESLISTTMVVVSILALIVWDSLFPDRLDSTILGAFPLRMRTVLCAKIAAIGTALSVAIVAVNSFTGLVFPLFILPTANNPIALLRCLAAYWIVVVLASLFAFLVVLAIQGIAIHLLTHGAFLRWSGLIQGGAFFAALTMYFLKPHLATPEAFGSPANSIWYAVLPSYWFLGLFQVLTGSPDAIFVDLAMRAAVAVGIATLFSGFCLIPAFARQMRRTVEQSGIVPHRRTAIKGFVDWIAKLICPDQEERALLAFISRTLARDRRHRSLVAIYAGLGVAYVFSGVARLLYEPNSFVSSAVRSWEIAGIPLSILFFLIIGIRVSFSIPVEVRANWLFRMTDPFGSGVYLSAARKALLIFAVAPVVAISAVAYGVFWPAWTMLAHLGFITAVGVALVELALSGWDKVPFACTHLPGKGNLKVMFGVYFVLLWFLSQMVAAAEYEALKTPAGYAVLMLITLAGWWLAARRAEALRIELSGLRFEDKPEGELTSLGISTAPPHRPSFGAAPQDSLSWREPLTLDGWNQDVRYALRMWRRNPAFTIVAIFLLAVGIAANTAVFTVANGILFKRLPFKDSERILYLRSTPRTPLFSYADFLDLRSQIRSFNSLTAYEYVPVNLSDQSGSPERYRCMRMSGNGLSVMKQHPIVGRDFLPEDELPGAIPVAMLTYDLWANRYGKDPSVIGKSIKLSEVTTVIVGVTPLGVRFAGNNDLWIPLTRAEASEKRDNRHLMIFGMLTESATQASAAAERGNHHETPEQRLPFHE